MRKKSIIGLIFLLSILSRGIDQGAFAWLRDANISNSSSSIGLGAMIGPYLTFEKIIDDKTSVGLEYLRSQTIPYIQFSYNKQIIGEKDGNFGLSFYVGAFYFGPIRNVLAPSRSDFIDAFPDIGMAISWNVFDSFAIRSQAYLVIPTYIECAWKLQKNIEMSLGYGIPLQLISIRYLIT